MDFIFSSLFFSFIAFHLWFLHLDCSHKWTCKYASLFLSVPSIYWKEKTIRKNVRLRLWVILSCLWPSLNPVGSGSIGLGGDEKGQGQTHGLYFQNHLSESISQVFDHCCNINGLIHNKRDSDRKWRSWSV